ncbi:MAG: maleylpyruvate isomerase N-terminal domain-containing protein, partial [Actinomycetota bacterium]
MSVVPELGIADRYRAAADSFIALARSMNDVEWASPVPCCPGWTARDVLSHVSGIPDDGLNGRLDGVGTPPWTASQVERNAGATVDELLDRWQRQSARFSSSARHRFEQRTES